MSVEAPRVESRWISVVFLESEEADDVLGMIDRDGPLTAMAHLERWDFGDETTDAALVNGYVYDAVPVGTTDRVIMDDESGYTLTYSSAHGHVSLLRSYLTPPEAEEPANLGTAGGRSRNRVEDIDRDRWLRVPASALRAQYRKFAR
ncbi:hypothetical protein LG299_06590 [Microbacterium lacus]|uniref:hypothetical protein n=1 Tax=Microbacterium lacus TaxID=415217 RepID=UPI003850095F